MLVACALAGTSLLPAQASYDANFVDLGGTPLLSGMTYYSASLFVPQGKSFQSLMSATYTPGWTEKSCAGSVMRNGDGGVGGGLAWSRRDGKASGGVPRAHIELYGEDEHGHPLVAEQEGEHREPLVVSSGPEMLYSWDHEGGGTWGGGYLAFDKDTRFDLVKFCTVAGAEVTSGRYWLRGDPGVTVLAESWGRVDASFFREWDFRGGAYARASEGFESSIEGAPTAYASAEAAVGAQRAKKVSFVKRAVAWFHTTDLLVPGVCVRTVCQPSPISIVGPAEKLRSIEQDNVVSLGSEYDYDPYVREVLDGLGPRASQWHGGFGKMTLVSEPPGDYEFRLEAWGGAGAGPGWIAPADPVVALVTADVDYPACSVSPIVDHAPAGHPICGDPA